jgi:hypothetical protein
LPGQGPADPPAASVEVERSLAVDLEHPCTLGIPVTCARPQSG